MFIKAYDFDFETNSLEQISIDDNEICVIGTPRILSDVKIIYPEYIERDNFIFHEEKCKEIIMFPVSLKNGNGYCVKQEDIGYIGDGVYCRKGE